MSPQALPLKTTAAARSDHLYALLLALIAVTVGAAFILIWLHGVFPRGASTSAVDLIVEAYRGLMAPEPTEQFTFAVLAVLMPLTMLVVVANATPTTRLATARPYLAPAVAALFLWPVFGADYVPTVVRNVLKPYSSIDTLAVIASLLGSAILCSFLLKSSAHSRKSTGGLGLTTWGVFSAAVFLQMAGWRVVSFASVVPATPWDGHADPLFYVMAQVNAGKTLLVDLPSQYGLFPELLGPLYQLIGLTVGRVSMLFAILQIVSMMGLYFVLERLVKSRVLLIITGLALVLLTFETVLLNANYEERYFQYWPLRFFWPAASVVVFHWFSTRPGFKRAAGLSALSAIATLWNLDSGLFVVVAFSAYLAARGALLWAGPSPIKPGAWRASQYFFAWAAHLTIASLVIAVFFALLRAKAGQPMHLSWLVEYQKVFADLGLAMLPLPRTPHPWMAVLGVYLAGLLQAFFIWKRSGHTSVRADLTFYLSMLGLGLFVYYAGRSHILNLITVCWPAAMLIAIYADEVLRRVRAGALHPSAVSIAVACSAMLIMPAASFLVRVPSFAERTWNQFATRGEISDHLATDELAFIKRHAVPGSECLILALRQGIYHAQAQVASPFVGPGIIEMVLIADQQRMMRKVYAGAYPCLMIGIGSKSTPNFRIDMAKVLEANNVIDRSPGSTMLFLTPKLR